MGEMQAASKKAISETRMPVNAACLITTAEPMCRSFLMQPASRDGGYRRAYSLNDRRDNSEVPRARSPLATGSI